MSNATQSGRYPLTGAQLRYAAQHSLPVSETWWVHDKSGKHVVAIAKLEILPGGIYLSPDGRGVDPDSYGDNDHVAENLPEAQWKLCPVGGVEYGP